MNHCDEELLFPFSAFTILSTTLLKCHHRQQMQDYMTKKKKSELPECLGTDLCPIGGNHPPNGEEFSLGCGLCRTVRKRDNLLRISSEENLMKEADATIEEFEYKS